MFLSIESRGQRITLLTVMETLLAMKQVRRLVPLSRRFKAPRSRSPITESPITSQRHNSATV